VPLGPEHGTTAVQTIAGTVPIRTVRWRQRVRIAGTIRSTRVQPSGGVPTLECVISDSTGSMSVVFLGRRQVAGLDIGRRLIAEGMVGSHSDRLAILNPIYELLFD
jgi:RecG-like helicase